MFSPAGGCAPLEIVTPRGIAKERVAVEDVKINRMCYKRKKETKKELMFEKEIKESNK